MKADFILNLIVFIISLDFIIDLVTGILNYKNFEKKLPNNVNDIYNKEEYLKSQQYKKENFRFELITSIFTYIIIIGILLNGILGYLDSFLRTLTFENELSLSLLFFASIYLINDLLKTPFQLYRIFVIEEKYGFNKMKISTYIFDKIKGYFISIVIGVLLITPLLVFIMLYPSNFWIYFWVVISLFLIFINMFYTSLIVPLFNKLEVLEDGDLKEKLNSYANRVGFALSNIFVIDGSKRSTKANAYFSGFGKNKKVVLYDTLIKNHTNDELVAVLAHEIGHYKLRHIISNMIFSILSTGLMLYIMSNFLYNSEISYALGGNISFRHFEIFAFLILYTPVDRFISILMNIKSRNNEYEADNFAVQTYKKLPMISALKKLSRDNLSNLTPHPVYEFLNYSHPSLSKRLDAIERSEL
ncbi:MAG: M48 family metallopeptidase [Bacteroidota bacterium]|nr:M48 family metallopeptidase [Bacteroidota bacterium]